jgi:hypothetical protein
MSRNRLAAVESDVRVVDLAAYRGRRSQARRRQDAERLPIAALPFAMAIAPFAFALCWMVWWVAPSAAASPPADDHGRDDRLST